MEQKHINNMDDISFDNKKDFILTPYIKDITKRALIYLNSGFPVHLKGPAGTGKTMTALYIAKVLGKPTTIIFGNEDLETSDMIGLQHGFRKKLILDNYIHSVHKRVEDFEQKWMDGRIVDTCESGNTLIYDEFTRSRSETNNILLSVLEEKVIELPISYTGENKLIKVHPEFRAIFTSNPEEYVGVYKSQDALVDRFITIELDFPDEESEILIAKAKSNMPVENVKKIVAIVRSFREQYKSRFVISLRDSIKLCKVMQINKVHIDPNNDTFKQICFDVLTSGVSVQKDNSAITQLRHDLDFIVNSFLSKSIIKEEITCPE